MGIVDEELWMWYAVFGKKKVNGYNIDQILYNGGVNIFYLAYPTDSKDHMYLISSIGISENFFNSHLIPNKEAYQKFGIKCMEESYEKSYTAVEYQRSYLRIKQLDKLDI